MIPLLSRNHRLFIFVILYLPGGNNLLYTQSNFAFCCLKSLFATLSCVSPILRGQYDIIHSHAGAGPARIIYPAKIRYRGDYFSMTLHDFLKNLENIKGDGKEYSARCPAHDDRKNSLSVSQGTDGKILLHCHAGCTPETVVSALGLTMNDLFPEKEGCQDGMKKTPPERGQVTDEYVYFDASGVPMLKKVRLEYSDGKSFYWQTFDGTSWKNGRRGITPPLFNQNAIPNTSDVFIVEGEKDVLTMKRAGFTAISLPDGAGSKWREEYGPLFHGKEVYIIPDNDAAGAGYATMLAGNLFRYADHVKILDLRTEWPSIWEKGDISDFCETYGEEETAAAVTRMINRASPWLPNHNTLPRFAAKRASEFGEDNTCFVWYPYIPIGDYSVLMAEGGTGTTMFCCGIAASLSRNEPLPGDDVNLSPTDRNILLISAEDRGELLKKRLKESGAVLDRILILDCMDSEGLNFNEGIGDFHRMLKDADPSLVIIDPWHAFLGEKVDINRVNALRPVLQKLANIAKDAKCGMILVSHVNKRAQGENINNSATGSVDLINAARSAFKIVKCDLPGNEDLRIAVHTKSNYAREGKSVCYTITEGGGVRWNGFSEITRGILEEANRSHKSPFAYLQEREEARNEEDALADAIREISIEGKTINVSYKEMQEKYGELIFGRSQPIRALEKLAARIYVEGIIIVTHKSVKYRGKSLNGFSVTRKDPFSPSAA